MWWHLDGAIGIAKVSDITTPDLEFVLVVGRDLTLIDPVSVAGGGRSCCWFGHNALLKKIRRLSPGGRYVTVPVLIAGAPRARPPVRTQRTGVFPLFLYHTFRIPRFYCHLRQRLLRPPRPPCLTSRRDHAWVLHTCRCGPHSPCIRPERPVRREGCPTVGRRSSGCSPGSPGCLRRALPSLPRQHACRRGRLGQWSPHLEEETRFAGIDGSQRRRWTSPSGQRDREMGCDLQRDRGRGTGLSDGGLGSRPGVAGSYGRTGIAAGGSAGRCGAAGGGGGQPGQVRDFARATGTLAQTDALDAAVLAHFAEAVDLPCVLCEKPRPRSSTPWLAEGIRC